MKCRRCQGLMVIDHLIDMEDDSGQLWLRGWRCVICGDVVDHRISRNRIKQAVKAALKAEAATSGKRAKKRDLVRLSA